MYLNIYLKQLNKSMFSVAIFLTLKLQGALVCTWPELLLLCACEYIARKLIIDPIDSK